MCDGNSPREKSEVTRRSILRPCVPEYARALARALDDLSQRYLVAPLRRVVPIPHTVSRPSVPDYAKRLAEALDDPNMRHLVRTVPGIAPPASCYPDTRSALRRFMGNMIRTVSKWITKRHGTAEK